MSGRLNVEIEVEGLNDLADAYANAPEAVLHEAERAGREAIPLLADAIGSVTNVDTGRMLRGEHLSLEGAFSILFTDAVPYTRYVNDRFQFVERGTEIARGAVDAVYERAVDRLAGVFAHQRIR